jgi:hypothetical protein
MADLQDKVRSHEAGPTPQVAGLRVALVEKVPIFRGIPDARVASGAVTGADAQSQAVGISAGDRAQRNAGRTTHQVHNTHDQQYPVSGANGRVGFEVDKGRDGRLCTSDAAGVPRPALWLVGGQGV